MNLETKPLLRNLAVVAHVDHGKTSLVDAMIWQSGLLRENDYAAERVMPALGREREKSLAVMGKVVSANYRGVRFNFVDTPGHADLGGDIDRTLRMVEGILLIVDACEGPLPQTRFALRKGLEAGLHPVVVINKIDLPGARPKEALAEVYDLFIDLDASEGQLDFPVVYCDARRGFCRRSPEGPEETLILLFETILRTVPAPSHDPSSPLQFLVTALDYDDFLGRLALGRVVNGDASPGTEVVHCRLDGSQARGTISGIYAVDGLKRVEVQGASAGDIVAVTGIEAITIGEALTDARDPRPLPSVPVDEPTIAIEIRVNDSPVAGLEGQYVTGRKLRERLWKEILANASIRAEETSAPDVFRVSGRGELQLAILLEMMRREGYEMAVGRPHILTREIEGKLHEPMEILVVDCPETFVGAVSEKVSSRKGRMTKMINHGTGRVRMEFRIPSRGLLGFRTEFLSDTRGTGIMNHVFDGHEPWRGDIPSRATGSMVSDRPGRSTAYSIEHLQNRGAMFVAPGDQVYEGMVVGENSRRADVDVNVTKDRRASARRASDPEAVVRLIPPRSMSLEQALEFIREDELVEITPRAIRIRKKILPASQRSA
jgi:GTP-binding protein